MKMTIENLKHSYSGHMLPFYIFQEENEISSNYPFSLIRAPLRTPQQAKKSKIRYTPTSFRQLEETMMNFASQNLESLLFSKYLRNLICTTQNNFGKREKEIKIKKTVEKQVFGNFEDILHVDLFIDFIYFKKKKTFYKKKKKKKKKILKKKKKKKKKN